MARIPQQIATRQLDTGGVVQYPQGGGPIGAAMEDFGASLQGLASRLADMQAKEDLFDAQVLEQEWNSAQDQADMDAVTNAPADGAGLHDSVYGEKDPTTGIVRKPGLFDKLYDQFTQRMPASQRQRWADMREARRGQRSVRMAAEQLTLRRAYEDVKLVERKNDILNRIAEADPDDKEAFEALKREYTDMVLSTHKDALSKEVEIKKMEEEAGVAFIAAVTERDPEKAKRLLGIPTQPTAQQGLGAAGSGDPIDDTVNRIIGVESSGNPNAKNPLSTATGLGQFIESTWLRVVKAYRPDIYNSNTPEQVLAMRRDPALSREMVKALTTESAEYLKNRGLPITRGNLYLAHFAGADGAVRVLKAEPGASVAAILGESKVRANPFLRGMTAADLTAWAAKKMGGPAPAGTGFVQGEIDPRVAALSYAQRIALANRADAAIRENMALLRGQLDTVVSNAPAAIQNTGRYDGVLPTEEHFIRAYGPEDGSQRYRAFDTAVQTAGQAHSMLTMPATEIQQLVTGAKPTSSGDDAALQSQRYEVLSNAAASIMKSRADDPNAYVRQAFPNLQPMWDAARTSPNDPSLLQAAIAATTAAQRQLGIPESAIRPLDDAMAESAVATWKNETAPQDGRVGAITSLLNATTDVSQRKAIFEQLVEAGLPDISEAAFAAFERDDKAAARRLFTAALTDVSKLPGKLDYSDAQIEERIMSEWMEDGDVGDRFYGLTLGVGQQAGRAERDSKLMLNAVKLRLRAGESLDNAVKGVGRDIFGEVQQLDGDSRVNVQALIPMDADPEQYLNGLAALMPKVLDDHMKLEMAVPEGADVADGTRAIMDASTAYKGRLNVANGEWRQVDDTSFVYILPDGLPVSDNKGNVIVYRPNLNLPVTPETRRERRAEEARQSIEIIPPVEPGAPAPAVAPQAPPAAVTPETELIDRQMEELRQMPPGGGLLSRPDATGSRLRPRSDAGGLTPSGSIPPPGSARWGS